MKELILIICLLFSLDIVYSQNAEKTDTLVYYISECQYTRIYKKSIDTVFTDLVDRKVRIYFMFDKHYFENSDSLIKITPIHRLVFDYNTNKKINSMDLVFKKDKSKYRKLTPFLLEYIHKKGKEEFFIRRGKNCLNVIPTSIEIYLFPLH